MGGAIATTRLSCLPLSEWRLRLSARSAATASPPRDIEAKAISNQPITPVELFRNDRVIHRVEGDGEEASLDLTDDDDVPPGTFYYLRVIETTGDKAWTSPIWME